ncbi:MAG: hypothetical protein QOI96_2042 [Verrucomicrobiota bacterium]
MISLPVSPASLRFREAWRFCNWSRTDTSPAELRPARLERATFGFGGRRSIQLSYGRGVCEYTGSGSKHNRACSRIALRSAAPNVEKNFRVRCAAQKPRLQTTEDRHHHSPR